MQRAQPLIIWPIWLSRTGGCHANYPHLSCILHVMQMGSNTDTDWAMPGRITVSLMLFTDSSFSYIPARRQQWNCYSVD